MYGNDEALLRDTEAGDASLIEDEPKKSCFNKKCITLSLISTVSILIGVVIGMLAAFSSTKAATTTISNQYDALPNCQIYQSFSCKNRQQSAMDSQYFDNRWNTPKRGEDRWKPGFQDMSTLAGYSQLKYSAGMKSCTFNIITKTSRKLDLTYYFDGIPQNTNSKVYDSSYNKILKVKVIAATGETLILDDIDFAWNAA
ncbi:hypothetical protein TVAG_108080 [Trichomonas vaginalis G3]|uniref:Uncharacterized protein n=1 Tax=Trichomonas vaginalis (strain ATCC PRA-98 / G3) TaxID=412133 RepID=A2FS25_TRIV3|nr:alpha-amylase family [Trichomonas vaginalis G3]EAX92291.1 hypothetical protein TVAG_108080 [Trichomonas vaginalis G3]KAI5496183.1 alpha-amylase family [Trichomonas vaginalis G3]|eukprot:XP_001305221.1 hypothetical protein [Trichomonas vaginalis G3]